MTATLTQITEKGEGGEEEREGRGKKAKCVGTICDVITNKCKNCPCSLYVKMMFQAHPCF